MIRTKSFARTQAATANETHFGATAAMKAEIHSSIATARHFLGFATDHCRAILNVALSSMSGGQVQSPAGAIAMEKQTQVERNWRFALLVLATGLLVGGIVQPVAAKDCNTFDCDIEWDERLLMPRNYNAVNKGQLEAEPTGGYIYRRNRFVAPPGTSANAFETCAGVKTWHPQHVVRLPNKDGRAYFMVAQSGRQGGWISLLQTAPDAIDSDDLLKDGAGGLYVWSDNYGRNSGNPAGAYNHPGKMEVIGGLLLVAAQDWITDLMITCDAIDNDGDILGRYGSLDAILFYDIRDPQYPKYLGKLDTEQLGIDPIDLPGDDVFSDFVGGYLRAEIDAVSLFRSPRDEWFLRIGGGGDAQLSKRVLKAKVGARADCGATSTLRGLPWLFEECPSQPQDGRIDGITAAYGMTFNSLNLGGGDSGTPGEVGLFWVYEEMKDTVCSIAGLCLEYSLFPIARWKWTEYGLEGQPEDEYLIGVDPRQRTDGFLVLDDLDGDSNGLWNTPSVYVTREGMPVIYAMRNYADPDAAGTLYQAQNHLNLDTAAYWAHLLHPDRVVTTCADSGVGSLRNAIGYGGNITFDLPPECNNTIQLTNGALVVYLYDVDIDATSAGGVTIVGGVPPIRDSLGGCTFGTMCPHLDARVFRIAKDINVTMSRLTITGGRAQKGAGIFNAGTLSLNDSTVTENTAQGYYYNPD
jgi:hypothetical protein